TGVIGTPHRLCISRIQGRIFQQAQPPVCRRIGMTTTARPVAPVVGVTAQVLPGQCWPIKMQDVEIGGTRVPVLAGLGHDAAPPCHSAGYVARSRRFWRRALLRYRRIISPASLRARVKSDWLRGIVRIVRMRRLRETLFRAAPDTLSQLTTNILTLFVLAALCWSNNMKCCT